MCESSTINIPVSTVVSKAVPFLPSAAIATTLIVYSLFEVNPVMTAIVPCISGASPSSGKIVTRYPVTVVAPPPRDGAIQLTLIDESVTSLMTTDVGLSKTIKIDFTYNRY